MTNKRNSTEPTYKARQDALKVKLCQETHHVYKGVEAKLTYEQGSFCALFSFPNKKGGHTSGGADDPILEVALQKFNSLIDEMEELPSFK